MYPVLLFFLTWHVSCVRHAANASAASQIAEDHDDRRQPSSAIRDLSHCPIPQLVYDPQERLTRYACGTDRFHYGAGCGATPCRTEATLLGAIPAWCA